MKNNFCFFLCLLCLLLFSSNGNGQTPDTLKAPDEEVQHFSKPEIKPADTAYSMQYVSGTFSVDKWKKRREFSYMRYLDSFLRKQKNLKTDTVSLDEKSGRIKRKTSPHQQPSSINKILNSAPLKIFFWLLAIIFIVFITYKVFFKNGIFKKPGKIRSVVDEDSVQELNEVSTYDSLIAEAESKNELNEAARYLYLKTLKNLSERGFIHFSPEKTNVEYVKEMQHHNYSDEFRELTRDYDYLWYGKFIIDKAKYYRLKEQFQNFNHKI
ncbi:MAG: DUF4129 domain-containing protein [Ginsengibacter sp.]